MTHRMSLRGIDTETWEKMDNQRGDTSREDFVRRLIRKHLFPDQPPQDQLPFVTEPTTVYGELPFTFIDLFAGIGGFRCGLQALGGKCIYSSEWDKFAAKTYRHWYNDDVDQENFTRVVHSEVLPDHDILAAGFPCQPFSLAGVSKKQSLGRAHGFDDPDQGNLFFAIRDAIEAKSPPVVFLENVKNLRSHDRHRTWEVIQGTLEECGYHVFDEVIDLSGWIPQHRERIFIVCFRRDVFGEDRDQIGFRFPNRPTDTPKFGDILESDPDRKYMLSNDLWTYLKDYKAKHRAAGNGFGYGIADRDGVSRTMSARYHKDGSEILIRQKGWRNPRRLTPSEAAQLQGFDEEYSSRYGWPNGFPQVVSDTQAYRQFGNAVSPRIVEAIGREILPILATRGIYETGNGTLLVGRKLAA